MAFSPVDHWTFSRVVCSSRTRVASPNSIGRFCTLRYSRTSDLPADLEVFLQSGPPPVVFMPSSFMAQGASFLRESVEACSRLQCRGILLTQFPEQLPAQLPDNFEVSGLSR